LLQEEEDVILSSFEKEVLAKIVSACLQEMLEDADFSPFVGPGVGIAGLRAVETKLKL
jgi:hypothetical protein